VRLSCRMLKHETTDIEHIMAGDDSIVLTKSVKAVFAIKFLSNRNSRRDAELRAKNFSIFHPRRINDVNTRGNNNANRTIFLLQHDSDSQAVARRPVPRLCSRNPPRNHMPKAQKTTSVGAGGTLLWTRRIRWAPHMWF